MLSTGAFNALLKTLEEPPEHVIFILATTDPQKLPQTILSRCQRYDFKRIKAFDMKASLLDVCQKENRIVSESAIDYICLMSDGAMRDALSLLDQAFSYFFDSEITLDNILEIAGSVDRKVFFEFTNALIDFDSIKLIEIINSLVMSSSDIIQFVTEEIRHLRDLLVASSDALNALNYSSEQVQLIVEQSHKIESLQVIFFIEEFSKLLVELKSTKQQRILLETTALKLCNAQVFDDDKNSLIIRVKKLEKLVEKLENIGFEPNIVKSSDTSFQNSQKRENIVIQKIEKAIPEDILKVKNDWQNIIKKLDDITSAYFKINVKVGYIDSDTLYLVCASNADFFRKRSESLFELLKELYSKEFNIKFIEVSEYNALHKNKYKVDGEYDYQDGNIIDKIKDRGIEIIVEDF